MSAREWKPGDVAMVTAHSGASYIAMHVEGEPVWRTGTQQFGSAAVTARPLVVIDPEDREQVEALHRASWIAYDEDRCTTGRVTITHLQKGLRSLVTPPKPEEPTGLGAVVVDADGTRWVRTEDLPNITGTVWTSAFSVKRAERSDSCEWEAIAAVKVLSEGVTQ